MRFVARAAFVVVLGMSAFGQSDRGTITGTVADPAGAVVPNAPVEAKNVETGAIYQAGASATGNFTLAQLPTGTYQLSVTVPGFKQYVRQNIVLQVTQTVRVDVTLEVGATSDSVTVSDVTRVEPQRHYQHAEQSAGAFDRRGRGNGRYPQSVLRGPASSRQQQFHGGFQLAAEWHAQQYPVAADRWTGRDLQLFRRSVGGRAERGRDSGIRDSDQQLFR